MYKKLRSLLGICMVLRPTSLWAG